jgi:predicted deacylase
MFRRKTIQGSAGPHLLITAGVHGDEYEPIAAVRRLAASIEPARVRGRITLVPLVNEAAFVRGRRTAEDGLDLARTCPGREDGSLTERVAAALSRLIRAADFYIDLHTGGTAIRILPLAGYVLHEQPAVLEHQRTMAQAFNLPIVWGTSGRLEGRSLSVARDAGVPAIYVEHGGGGGCDARGVEDCVVGCLQVCRALGMYDEPAASGRVRYVVEDDRDESGHLQAQYPADKAGYFEPAVELGDIVAPGQVLGRILGPLGEACEVIAASSGGVVLMLRMVPAVRPGDALAALLPTTEPGIVRISRAGDISRPRSQVNHDS